MVIAVVKNTQRRVCVGEYLSSYRSNALEKIRRIMYERNDHRRLRLLV